jgi:hypothetical protein
MSEWETVTALSQYDSVGCAGTSLFLPFFLLNFRDWFGSSPVACFILSIETPRTARFWLYAVENGYMGKNVPNADKFKYTRINDSGYFFIEIEYENSGPTSHKWYITIF